jgi:hypothetical protein
MYFFFYDENDPEKICFFGDFFFCNDVQPYPFPRCLYLEKKVPAGHFARHKIFLMLDFKHEILYTCHPNSGFPLLQFTVFHYCEIAVNVLLLI